MSDHLNDDAPNAEEDPTPLADSQPLPSVIPAEKGEGPLTAAESRAKADPGDPTGPGGRSDDDDEFTDPNAQPPA